MEKIRTIVMITKVISQRVLTFYNNLTVIELAEIHDLILMQYLCLYYFREHHNFLWDLIAYYNYL